MSLWDDIQQLISQIQTETQQARKLCSDLQASKADKKELNDTRAKFMSTLEGKADTGDFT